MVPRSTDQCTRRLQRRHDVDRVGEHPHVAVHRGRRVDVCISGRLCAHKAAGADVNVKGQTRVEGRARWQAGCQEQLGNDDGQGVRQVVGDNRLRDADVAEAWRGTQQQLRRRDACGDGGGQRKHGDQPAVKKTHRPHATCTRVHQMTSVVIPTSGKGSPPRSRPPRSMPARTRCITAVTAYASVITTEPTNAREKAEELVEPHPFTACTLPTYCGPLSGGRWLT